MKERTNIAEEEDMEEMKRWRSLNRIEMDLCWKKLAERMEEEVLDKYKVEAAKQAGGVNRRGGDEAAAQDGYHERSDKEKSDQKEGWMPRIVGGSELLAKD